MEIIRYVSKEMIDEFKDKSLTLEELIDLSISHPRDTHKENYNIPITITIPDKKEEE